MSHTVPGLHELGTYALSTWLKGFSIPMRFLSLLKKSHSTWVILFGANDGGGEWATPGSNSGHFSLKTNTLPTELEG